MPALARITDASQASRQVREGPIAASPPGRVNISIPTVAALHCEPLTAFATQFAGTQQNASLRARWSKRESDDQRALSQCHGTYLDGAERIYKTAALPLS